MSGELPQLRPELRFVYRDEGARSAVIIEDPLGGTFCETDHETAAFARMLTGTRTAEEALASLRLDLPGIAITPSDVPSLVDELRRHGLLVGSDAATPTKTGARRIGLISQRIRLGAWDRFFATCAMRLRWLYGPVGLIAWSALLIAGLAELVGHWSSFRLELGTLFSPDMVIMLWVAWVVSKAWHEFQHGVVARLYGVEVREVGILFILFLPLGAYVDVTGAWRVTGRWRRLHITAAGIMGELALGAAAVLLWSGAEHGLWRAFLQSLIVATTVSTLVFNANPLMRYDGYYALVDLFGVSNLYQRGMSATRDRAIFLLSGLRPRIAESRWIELYGWLAMVWRVVAATTLTIVATHLAFGFGLVLGAVVVWSMVVAPLLGFARSLWGVQRGNPRPLALRIAATAAAIVFLWFLPLPTWISAPGIIAYRDAQQIRATSAGMVTDIGVSTGDMVTPGTPLITLANPSLDADHRRLIARRDGTRILLARAQSLADPAAQQGARQALSAMEEEIADTQTRLAGLKVTAPRAGILFGKDIDALAGRWVARGELIGEIGEPSQLEVRVWLRPADVEMLHANGSDLSFRSIGFAAPAVPISLTRLDPVASNALPPPAITAEGGGPLAIDLRQKDHKLADVRFSSRFAPKTKPDGWLAGVPGTLTSGVRWKTAGSSIREWLENVNLGHLPQWAKPRT
ncbi:efflux RND transporter periplasmic adaptor subunit [Ensifer sp.]|uniref:efflux RND transporter periplasmic adaptor subunit n=1 Tax=Ensifer sp. TaxID=1872086 RepID=UPI00289B0B91|nr:HlyD family efflux transporter periplasmic adaptor subunit [Ensifer sp.]